MKWKLGVTVAVGLMVFLFAAHAQATLACSGGTTPVASGSAVLSSTLLGVNSGNCIAAGDKIFGDFAISGGLTGTGSVSFTFLNPLQGDVTIGFSGVVLPGASGTLSYEVDIDPTVCPICSITDFQADFTVNALSGKADSSTLITTTPLGINCTRTVNPSDGTCPETVVFPGVLALDVSETVTAGKASIATALTNTISQTVPEPSSLLLLGSGLLGLGFLGRRKNK